ncbi:AI-2E family transporter [Paracoccus sp. T5]|uniref:AI-2E family transporter n=1 Tax=Paracoccus sp. T5 TaxID=3402161 RepID=UPI003AF7B53D
MTDQGHVAGHGRARTRLLTTVTIILVGWALHATGSFMVPVVFSIFLALLVAPLDRKIARHVPDWLGWLGRVAAMGVILATLAILVALIWFSAQQVVQRFPDPESAGNLLPRFGQELQGILGGQAPGQGMDPSTMGPSDSSPFGRFLSGSAVVEQLGSLASGTAMTVLSTASGLLIATVAVIFLTLLMLIEREKWSQKLATMLSGRSRRDAMETIAIIADLMRRYLMTRTVLGVTTGLLYAGWLWLFGIDLLVVWALLAFILNFVPTLGSLVAGALPVLYAVVQKDPATAMAIGAGIFVIEQVMGNYVDPRVQGRQVSLSSLVVLITLLVWGWIWGIAGAVLAVPITIALMIICAHIEPLRPVALMLSDASDYEELDRQARR